MAEPKRGRERRPGESVIEWAAQTGRINADTAEKWRVQAAADPTMLPVFEHVAGVLAAGSAVPLTAAGVLAPTASAAGESAGRQDTGGGLAFALNPLAEHYRQTDPAGYARAVKYAGPPPTLFPSGDLPVACASGMDPARLKAVATVARPAIQAVKDLSRAEQMLDMYADEDMAMLDYGPSVDWQSYQAGFAEWKLNGDMGAAAAARAARERQVAAAGGVRAEADLTDDEAYDALFGPGDRRKAAERDAHERAVLEGRAVGVPAGTAAAVRAAREVRARAGGQ